MSDDKPYRMPPNEPAVIEMNVPFERTLTDQQLDVAIGILCAALPRRMKPLEDYTDPLDTSAARLRDADRLLDRIDDAIRDAQDRPVEAIDNAPDA